MGFQSTSEVFGGGEPIFHPGFMYCGMASSQHFRGSITRTGNKFTVVGSFYAYDYLTADDTYKRIFLANGSNPSIYTYPTDHGTDPRAIIFLVRNNATTAICTIKAETPYANDDQKINFLFAFDGDNGLAKLVINGQEEDDLAFSGRVAPTTGTLYTGARTVGICGDDSTGARPHSASVSFFSYANAYLPDAYSDFFDAQGNPIYQETADWPSTGWGAQPELYAPNGDPQDNLGSAGAFTAYNGPKVAYKKTALVYSNKGLGTIGDITARDVRQGKVGWANAQRITGALDHNGLLLFHQFDGAASTPISSLTPDFDYGGVGAFSESGSNNIYLDGTGHVVSNGGYLAFFDPQGGWPSRAGKTRCYRVWGKVLNPVATSYFPTIQINYVDGNNFWSSRSMYNGNVYAQMYEWIAGGVGEGVRQSTSVFAASGEYYFDMVVRDFGDTVSMTLTCVDESGKTSDLTVSEPSTIQLYKATRPNQETAKFVLGKWEVPSGWLNNYIRGIMVWDE